MKEIKILKQQISDNDYIVFPVSYINPLASIVKLENELASNIKYPCKILVDLLLCNGANYNRFVSMRFDGIRIDKDSIKIIDLDADDKKNVNQFYRENKSMITKGVLTSAEYMEYVR